MAEFNALAEIRALAVRAKLAGNETAARALESAMKQVQEVILAKIPADRNCTEQEIVAALGAERLEDGE
jgi:N-acetylglutamate synthase-like GNAT family acetyltransferase